MIVRRGTLNGSVYVIAALIFFVTIGLDALMGRRDLQFYADSLTYHEAARNIDIGLGLITVTSNYLGPVLILKALGSDMVRVFFFNVLVYLVSLRLVMKHFVVASGRYVMILALSPILFSSMQSVNKEILSLLVIVLAAVYLKSGRPIHGVLSFVLSVLVRWQFVVALGAAYFIRSRFNPLREHRWASLLLLVAAISIAYPLQLSTFEHINRVAELGEASNTGVSGIYSRLIWIQNVPLGYLVVVVPKALHLYMGLVFRWALLFDWSEFYNNVVIVSQTIANALVLAAVVLRRRFRINNDLILLALVFGAVFALSPIYNPRYLFPVYVLFAVVLSERQARTVSPA